MFAGFEGSYCSGFRTVGQALHPKSKQRELRNPGPLIVEARNLEHSFRRISARIPYTLP